MPHDMKELEPEVDKHIAAFDSWFAERQPDKTGLSKPEAALLKTYLWYLMNDRRMDPVMLGLKPVFPPEEKK